jgi:hypothetical protein
LAFGKFRSDGHFRFNRCRRNHVSEAEIDLNRYPSIFQIAHKLDTDSLVVGVFRDALRRNSVRFEPRIVVSDMQVANLFASQTRMKSKRNQSKGTKDQDWSHSG